MKKGLVHEQIEIASASLKRRRKFEAGWYDDRIAELESALAVKRDDAIAEVRMTFESAAIDAWKSENARLQQCCTQRGARMQILKEWMDEQIDYKSGASMWDMFWESMMDDEAWFKDGVPK